MSLSAAPIAPAPGPLVSSALSYAARGWRVIPCHTPGPAGCSCPRGPDCPSPGKHPRIKTGREHELASVDPDQIRAWWSRWPDANIGIATGMKSGAHVLDLDVRPDVDGTETLRAWEIADGGTMPRTPYQRTGGGGSQYVFAATEYPVRNFQRMETMPGIDLRADGGLAILPPSLHVSGRRYEWDIDAEDDAGDLLPAAPWPSWLLARLGISGAREKAPASKPRLDLPEILETGKRHPMLFALAGAMRRVGAGELEILAALRAANLARCRPPLELAELEKLARGVQKYQPAPASLDRPPHPAEQFDRDPETRTLVAAPDLKPGPVPDIPVDIPVDIPIDLAERLAAGEEVSIDLGALADADPGALGPSVPASGDFVGPPLLVPAALELLASITPESASADLDRIVLEVARTHRALEGRPEAALERARLERAARERTGYDLAILRAAFRPEPSKSRGRRGPGAPGRPGDRAPEAPAAMRDALEQLGKRLMRGEKGAPLAIAENVLQILLGDPRWAGVLAYDEFACRVVARSQAPSHAVSRPAYPVEWSDADDVEAAAWIQRTWKCLASPALIRAVVDAAARRAAFHPVREYLGGLIWDGVERTSMWLADFCGAPNTAYTQAVGRAWLIAAVARVTKPGCKADAMLVIEGRQNAGKSQAIAILAGQSWFSDELENLGSKDAALQLQGRWIIEMGELDALSRVEATRAKAFLSRAEDRFRPPYGFRTQNFPRQCIFAGSTNDDSYLRDATGARRFWPVKCGIFDLDGLRAVRDQLWAEALALYSQGELWWITSGELEKLAEEQQEARYHHDEWESAIGKFTRGRAETTVSEILDKVIFPTDRIGTSNMGKWTQPDQNRVARALKRLGFSCRVKRIAGRGVQRTYVREGAPVQQEIIPDPDANF